MSRPISRPYQQGYCFHQKATNPGVPLQPADRSYMSNSSTLQCCNMDFMWQCGISKEYLDIRMESRVLSGWKFHTYLTSDCNQCSSTPVHHCSKVIRYITGCLPKLDLQGGVIGYSLKFRLNSFKLKRYECVHGEIALRTGPSPDTTNRLHDHSKVFF